jgi:HK97 family phage major capsid protein
MAELKEIMDEVKTLAHELDERVKIADAEQKSRGEELTSKQATMAAEFKSAVDSINLRINELTDQWEQQRIAAARPPFGSSSETKSHSGFVHKATQKALKRKGYRPQVGWGKFYEDEHDAFVEAMMLHGDVNALTQEQKSLIVPSFMPAERKALYAADATTGGFFASTDFMNELQAYRLLVSNMRRICRVQATSGEKVQMPNLANDTTVYWATEQANFTDSSDPTTGMLSIPVHEMRGLLKVSTQNLEDSMFNLEDFMKDRLVKNFAKKEGAAFVNGTGSGQPRGILSYPSKASSGYAGGSAGKNNVTDAIPYVASGASAGKINADDVLNVAMDLKSDYDAGAAYIFTRGTLNTIRLFKDSQNRPLWQPFAGGDLPAQIYNHPYVEMPDMPEISSGNLAILVGDFSNYMIVDRVTLNIQQLNELYAASGLIGFIARMRVGGDVLLPEAFRTLKVN